MVEFTTEFHHREHRGCTEEHEVASSRRMATGKDIIKIAALAGGAVLLKSALSHLFEYDLRDKTVLITGGSRGLGLVMAREFAREGARLAICARDD